MLIDVFWKAGDVKIGIAIIGKLLQLSVKRLSSEAGFVAEIVEAANALLCILEVVVSDEAETFAETRMNVDDRLRHCNLSKA